MKVQNKHSILFCTFSLYSDIMSVGRESVLRVQRAEDGVPRTGIVRFL